MIVNTKKPNPISLFLSPSILPSKLSIISRQSLSQDKKLLKEKIENGLDTLLFELNNKEEHKLVEDVIGIMNRLEIIFYDSLNLDRHAYAT